MAADAGTLNCPMCGASASTAATRCEHCGARLATVACPSCFGLMFIGEKFCSHCGAKAARTEVACSAQELCPRCREEMNAVSIGNSNLRECPRCEGIWADADSLQKICTDREEQSFVLGMAAPVPVSEGDLEKNIRYVPCPVCKQLMNRVNFANCSHVVVDVCRSHGTWFDKDELRRIVEFIRAGGLGQARAQQIAGLEQKQRSLSRARLASAWETSNPSPNSNYAAWDIGITAAAALLKSLLR